LDCTSATHWFTAFALQLDPEPEINAWLPEATAGLDVEPMASAARTRALAKAAERRMADPLIEE
jgi:hypothetical protein